jgi:phospholipase C
MPPLSRIRHLVVLMLENRSFDNMLGLAYDRTHPPRNLVPADGPTYFGLDFGPNGTTPGSGYWNPSNAAFFDDPSVNPLEAPISPAAPNDFKSPSPDPGEHFDRITAQIFGHGENRVTPANNEMLGFLLDYAGSAGSAVAAGIMRYYTPQHVPVMTALAQQFAVCDRWFAASPTQTLPNRSFFHTGTSCGKVNNWPYDPLDFNAPTIFNVLDQLRCTPWDSTKGPTWKIYKDSLLRILDRLPATSVQFPHLWLDRAGADLHFKHIDDFHADAAAGTLPTYSFLEPRLLIDGNDQHPPRDIRPGEQLVFDIYETVRKSPKPEEILLVITYDEHGGCYDHVPPPFGATAPDPMRKNPPFNFDRWGVRVPAIFISPLIEEGTVFRSTNKTAGGEERPYDHTSIPATIKKWLTIPDDQMLTSARIADAPIVDDSIVSRTVPRTMPTIPPPHPVPIWDRVDLHLSEPSNDLEVCYAIGLTHRASGASAAQDPTLRTKLQSHEFLIRYVIQQASKLR